MKSLNSKLVIFLLLIGLIPLIVSGSLSYRDTSDGLTKDAYHLLEALRGNKKSSVEAYGDLIVNQVLTLSESQDVARNFRKFKYGFDNYVKETTFLNEKDTPARIARMRRELAGYYINEFGATYQTENPESSLNPETLLNQLTPTAVALQYSYILRNPAPLGSKHEMLEGGSTSYDNAHKTLHGMMRTFLEKFGYYDIFLVDNQGQVIYSVFKELDFATNLLTGPYASSGLAKAFVQANQLESSAEYALVDYDPYTPSYEAPASFISSPVIYRGERIGALIFQMPLQKITDIMSLRSGLGETGEAYLVGPDKLMRSDSHKAPDSFSVRNSFHSNNTVDNEAVSLALAGKSGLVTIKNYLGQDVLTGYSPVSFAGQQWAMLVEIERNEIFATLQQIQFKTMLLLPLFIFAILGVALWIAKGVTRPVKAMQKTMETVVNQGDFSRRIEITSNDEIGQTAGSFNTMLAKLEETFSQVNHVMSGFAGGDFSNRMDMQAAGDLARLKDNVNKSASAVESVVYEVNEVVGAIAAGDFDRRVQSEVGGDLNRLKQGVNQSAQAVSQSMAELARLLTALSEGRLNERSTTAMAGGFQYSVDRANESMQAMQTAFSAIGSVMDAIAQGQLDSRVDVDMPGDLAVIKGNINQSLDQLSDVLTEVAQVLSALAAGDLGKTINTQFSGDFETIKQDTNTTVANLKKVVSEISASAHDISEASDNLSEGNNSLSLRSEQQSRNLEQTAASMEEITTTIQQSATNANKANTMASEAQANAKRGGQVVNETIDAMGEINLASKRIAEIISVIDEIAFQTNLLALNAAVEAARAGEKGRGFAVVASEVRDLAGRSSKAAGEIKKLIEDCVDKVDIGSNLVTKSGATLTEILNSVNGVSSMMDQIALAANEQSVGADEVNRAVMDLQTLTQQNSAMAEEAASASEEMGNTVNGLNGLVQFFKNVRG